MNQQEAQQILEDSQSVIAFATGSMSYIKELAERCLDSDVAATVARRPGEGGG